MNQAPQLRSVEQEDPPATERRHGGNGHNGGSRGSEDRLRNAEIQLAEIKTKLDTQLNHLATKNELTNVKVWVLCGVLGGMGIAAGIAMAIANLLWKIQ